MTQKLKPEFPVTGKPEDEQAYQEELAEYQKYKAMQPKIDGAIFIASFSEQLIRENVTMPEPEWNPEVWDFRNEFDLAVKEYKDHVANRRTFPYPVKEEQDGKEIRESEFYISCENWPDKVCGCYLERNNPKLRPCTNLKQIAIPIEPDTPLITKDELVRKGEAGYEWLNYIKQFPKLDELWNQLPNVPNVWLSQQIDIFAGKYPSKPEPDSAMGWLKKEGYPDVMPMTLDNLGIILDRYTKYLSSPPEPSSKEWVSKEEYDHAINEIGQLQEQLKEANEYIRDLQHQLQSGHSPF